MAGSAYEGHCPGQEGTAGFYDSPVIHNTRLPSGVRCAVTLSIFSVVAADIATVCPPGKYDSLKDRPYYDEVRSFCSRMGKSGRCKQRLHPNVD